MVLRSFEVVVVLRSFEVVVVLRSFEVVVVLRSFEVVVVLRSFEVVVVLRSFDVVEVLRSFEVVEVQRLLDRAASLSSERSIPRGINFKKNLQRAAAKVSSGPHHRTGQDSVFKRLKKDLSTFVQKELKKFQRLLSTDYPECLEPVEDEEQRSSSEALLKITLNFLRRMDQKELAERLWSRTYSGCPQRKLKEHLQQRFECVFEGIAKAGAPTLLNQIYTELYITEGGSSEVNQEHEWSALAFILLSSEEDLDQFDLSRYCASEEALLRLLPVVKASTKALLSCCELSDRSCGALASVLSSQSSSLRVLDLSHNDLKDSGLKLLSDGLKSPHCKLETLSLSGCLVSEEGCASLASALRSNPSHLRELDLSYNHPGDTGVKLLSALLEDPHCTLHTLRLEHSGAQRLTPGLRKSACPAHWERAEVYMDSCYTSPALAIELAAKDSGLCGTVNYNRRGMPKGLKPAASEKARPSVHAS
uniref:FISNA domain-containing protein n=1 Tax=Knipowitschia caucasica TaxID=637954 RepID=A0AAV2M1M1_KNICA